MDSETLFACVALAVLLGCAFTMGMALGRYVLGRT